MGILQGAGANSLNEIKTMNIMIGFIIAQAKKDISLNANPHENFDSLFPPGKKIDVFRVSADKEGMTPIKSVVFNGMDSLVNIFDRSRFRFHTVNDSSEMMAKRITDQLDNGKSVWVSMVKFEPTLNQDGVLKLSEPDRRILTSADPKNIALRRENGHGTVIEGYKRDEHGHLKWLLVRDSQGSEHYDYGYIHVPYEDFQYIVNQVFVLP